MLSVGRVGAAIELQDNFSQRLIAAAGQISVFEAKAARLGDSATKIGRMLTVGLTLPLAAMAAGSVKAAIDFESSFAGVGKTVDGVMDNAGKLTAFGSKLQAEFRNMAKEMPLSVNAINAVGEAAGALGIKKENITSFTATMVKLGATTNLSADQAATSLARLTNIMGTSQNDVERLGNALVGLGNAGASTEQEIVDMALRIAGAGKTVKMTEGDVLGLANALSSVGIEAEMGGSAISKTMINIAAAVENGGEKLEKFAEISGKSSVDFARAWKDDAGQAFASFLSGLGKVEKQGGSLLKTLSDLDVTEVRMRDTLLRVANAGGLVAESMNLGNEAFRTGSQMTDEYNKRVQTTAAQLQITKNRLYDVGVTIGSALLPTINRFVQAVGPALGGIAKAFEDMPTAAKLGVMGIITLLAVGGPLLMAIGGVVKAIGTIKTALLALQAAETAGALGGLVTGMNRFGAAGRAILTVLNGPLGLIAALGGAAIAFTHFKTQEIKASADAMFEASKIINQSVSTLEEAKVILDAFAAGKAGAKWEGPLTIEAATAFQAGAKSIKQFGENSAIATSQIGATSLIIGSFADAAERAAGTKTGGGVASLSGELKSARTLIASLSKAELAEFREAVKSGAFSIEDLAKGTAKFSNAGDVGKLAAKLLSESIEGSGKAALKASEKYQTFLDKFAGKELKDAGRLWQTVLENTSRRAELLASHSLRAELLTAVDEIVARFGSLKAAGLGALQPIVDQAKKLEQQILAAGKALGAWPGGRAGRLETLLPADLIAQRGGFPGGLTQQLLQPHTQWANYKYGPNDLVNQGLPQLPGTTMPLPGMPSISSWLKGFGGMQTFGKDLAATALQSLTGGGDITKSIGGLVGNRLGSVLAEGAGKTLTNVLGKTIGGALGSVIPGLGTIVGSFAGAGISKLFGGLFGKSKEQKELEAANKEIDALKKGLVDTVGGMNNLRILSKLTGVDIEQGFAGKGKKGLEEFKGKIEELQKKTTEFRQTFNSDLGSILSQAQGIGFKLPDSMKPYFDQMKRLGLITDENAFLLDTLANEGEVSFQRMEQAAQKYGINVEALGSSYNKLKFDDAALAILEDYDMLIRGGADVNGVLEGMADEFSEIAQRAMRLGISMPENFRPILQSLVDKGLLLDESKNKIETLNGMKFGDPIILGLERIALLLEDLIKKFGTDLPQTIRDIPPVNIHARLLWRNEQAMAGEDGMVGAVFGGGVVQAQYFARGGRSRILQFVPRGSDTVPAMLTPGEMILNATQQQALAKTIEATALGLQAMQVAAKNSSSPAGRPATINVNISGRRMARAILPHLEDEISIEVA
jgi:TP901 family phage tail tape measure protein